jgi:hypothetical protein
VGAEPSHLDNEVWDCVAGRGDEVLICCGGRVEAPIDHDRDIDVEAFTPSRLNKAVAASAVASLYQRARIESMGSPLKRLVVVCDDMPRRTDVASAGGQ